MPQVVVAWSACLMSFNGVMLAWLYLNCVSFMPTLVGGLNGSWACSIVSCNMIVSRTHAFISWLSGWHGWVSQQQIQALCGHFLPDFGKRCQLQKLGFSVCDSSHIASSLWDCFVVKLGLRKTAATPTLLACLIVRCSCNGQDGNLEFAALCVSKITAELETVEGRGENPSFHYETRALQIVDSSEGIAVVLTTY